jgi:hypothetical protein
MTLIEGKTTSRREKGRHDTSWVETDFRTGEDPWWKA